MMHGLQIILSIAFGAAFGLIVGWALWGERRK